MSVPRDVRLASALAFAFAAVGAVGVLAYGLSLRHLAAGRDDLIGQPGGGQEARDAVGHIGADLRYQLIVAAITLVLMAGFGLALRRPLPWIRGAVWVSSILLFLGWGCGIAQSTELETERGSPAFPELQAAFRALLPGWYTLVAGLLVGAAFVFIAVLWVSLVRTGAAEFYQYGGGAAPPGGYAYLRPAPRPQEAGAGGPAPRPREPGPDGPASRPQDPGPAGGGPGPGF